MNKETTNTAEITEPSIKLNSSRPLTNTSKRYGDFLAENNKLYFMQEDQKNPSNEFKNPLGELVRIKASEESLESGKVSLTLEYWYLGNRKEIQISRGDLQKREFSKLMSYGVNASENVLNKVLIFLDKQEKEDILLTHTHQNLGWLIMEDKLVFKHQTLIGTDEVKSTYSGKFNIQPKGTFEGWENIVKQHILQQTPLEFALVLGFSATVYAYLATFRSIDTLVVHIYGESSKGKTTATITATSIFGRPTIKEDGLLLTWDSTTNALIHRLAGVNGVAIGIDEASMSNMKDFSRMIYQLAASQEKARLTSDIQLREKGSWSGTLISNAEHSLQQKSNQNSGLLVRLPEYGNVQWTKSAEHADIINRGFEGNYGHAGPRFAEHLLKQDQEQLLQRLKVHENELLNVMTVQDHLTNRLASKFAVLLLTATLMNELFSFQVDVDAIRDFIVEHEQNVVEDRDIGKRAIAALIPQIIQYNDFFDIRNVERTTHQCYGTIQEKAGYTEVAILKPKFEEWLADAGFTDSSVVLRSLKDKEVLDYEAGKNTRKRKLPDGTEASVVSPQVVYVLKLEKGSLSNHRQPVEVERVSQRKPVQSTVNENSSGDIFKPTSEKNMS